MTSSTSRKSSELVVSHAGMTSAPRPILGGGSHGGDQARNVEAGGCPNFGHRDEAGKVGGEQSEQRRASVSRCREALGEKGVGLTDAEIEQMRDYLYQLLDIIAEELEQNLRNGRSETCGAA